MNEVKEVVVDIKEASKITGLKVCELKRGCLTGKYPFFRSGNEGKSSKYLFSVNKLLAKIDELAGGEEIEFDNEDDFEIRKVNL